MTEAHEPSVNEMAGGGAAPDGARACGLGRRGLAMLYDVLLVLGLLIIAGLVALPVTGDQAQAGRDPLFTLYLVAVWFVYLGWCWSRPGQTLGMRAWSVHIEAESNLGWRTSAVRFAVSLLSAACLGLGFWTSVLRADRACWHDLASHTRLVHRPRRGRRSGRRRESG